MGRKKKPKRVPLHDVDIDGPSLEEDEVEWADAEAFAVAIEIQARRDAEAAARQQEREDNVPSATEEVISPEELADQAIFLAAMSKVDALSDKDLKLAKGLGESPDSQDKTHAGAVGRGSQSGGALGPLGVMNFVRAGVPRKIMRQLRRGQLKWTDDLDLHGLTWKEAKQEVGAFLRSHNKRNGYAFVLIIHGKGHGKVLGQATLKSRLYDYLQQQSRVAAVISALPKDGGLGAAYVLLN